MQLVLTPEEQVHVDAVVTVKIAMKRSKELMDENKYDEAAQILKQVLRVIPETLETAKTVREQIALCEENKTQQTVDESKLLVDEAIKKSFSYMKNGCFNEAIVLLNQVLRVDPESKDALMLLGLCKQKTNDHEGSKKFFEEAIKLDPSNGDFYNNLAISFACLGDREKSIETLRKAIEINPDNPAFYNNLGLQYRNFEDYNSAIKTLEEGLAKSPNDMQLLHNLGGIYGEEGNLDRAEFLLKKTIEIDPNFANGHMSLASIYMYKGEYEKGWKEMEYRFDAFEHLQAYKICYNNEKKWNGKDSIEGKRVLVYCEQGVGDSLMMLRYVKYLREKGAYVILHCSPRLQLLFERINLADELIAKEVLKVSKEKSELPDHDYQTSLMSLPLLLEKYIPEPEVYISTDREVNFSEYSDKIKIGICWAGNLMHPNDVRRSCHLKHFKVLQEIPNVKLFSLNLGPNARTYVYKGTVDYTEDCDGMGVVDMAPFLESFDDLAAIINGLDYVVSIDSAPVHLAGAMGKKVFMVLPSIADWRWRNTGSETPWYKNVKIFRQKKLGDWSLPFQEIKETIENENHLQN